MWEIQFSHESLKFMNRLNKKSSSLIKEKLKNLKQWLEKNEPVNIDIKKLKGEWDGYYRVRQGDFRIILNFDKSNKIIFIHEIASRGGIY